MPGPTHVILPGTERELLRKEWALAFTGLGCRVTFAEPSALRALEGPGALPALLDGGSTLLFSINFQGLEPLRQSLECLRRGNGRAAVWCVDNPWNVLSAVRDPLWKTLPLFVTDASFVEPLKKHGAQKVHHLPLAVSPELFAPKAPAFPAGAPSDPPFLFVGRSAFPGKEAFFAGQSLSAPLLREAAAMLRAGFRPDLRWWEQRLDCGEAVFWPGKKARIPAYGAEESNLLWRCLCLQEAAQAGQEYGCGTGLDLYGDAGWGGAAIPHARLRPPVDYYGSLPALYARARYTLCLTSLQLPAGLNQRHFDVWMAGGFCLSDATPGLELFPQELTRAMCFQKPADIAERFNSLERSGARAALIKDWQSHLRERHCYAHRALSVFDVLDSNDNG